MNARGLAIGVDGCRGGWVSAGRETAGGAILFRLHRQAQEFLSGGPPGCLVGIDIPIGLAERGPRTCDIEARRRLGKTRGSSVFPAPVRPVLSAGDYRAACAVQGLSFQTWNITAKIREVDDLLRGSPALAAVFEVHPETSFAVMNGSPLACSKKTSAGRAERTGLLRHYFGESIENVTSLRMVEDGKPVTARADDLLDAAAALWTVERIAAGTAFCLPAADERDRFGLRMAIWA